MLATSSQTFCAGHEHRRHTFLAMKPRAFLLRAAVFALIWWVLAEGRMDGWGVGVVSVLLAAAVSLILSPTTPGGLVWRRLPGFAWFFLRESLKGGLQVAWLAFRPTNRLAPAILALPLSLPPGPQRVLFVNTLNLLPGTLGVELEEATLHLHVLDARQPVAEEVGALQARIARLYGDTT